MRFIRKIGVELEGGINDSELDELRREFDFDYTHDGSVHVDEYDHEDAELQFCGSYAQVEKFAEMVFKYLEQNNSCGNHFHLSFDDTSYWLGLFSYQKFWERFMDAYRKIMIPKGEKYERRLSNGYCRTEYNAEKIIRQLEEEENFQHECRYTAINLLSYEKHGTVEIRIMPYASDFLEFKEQLDFVVDTIEKIMEKGLTDRVIEVRQQTYHIPASQVENKIIKETELFKIITY